MGEHRRRDVDNASRVPPCQAWNKAVAGDKQEWRLLEWAEAAMLTTTKSIRLARSGLGDEARAAHTIGIWFVASAHGDRKSETMMRRLSDQVEGLGGHNTTNPIDAFQMRAERRDASGTIRKHIDQG